MAAEKNKEYLHDHATRGEPLTVKERAQLETWYNEQNNAEMVMFAQNTPTARGTRAERTILPTYKAILRGNQLEWDDNSRVNIAADHAVAVYVTILDEPIAPVAEADDLGQRMATALEKLAQLHACDGIVDPAAWERQIRQDRELPGRET